MNASPRRPFSIFVGNTPNRDVHLLKDLENAHISNRTSVIRALKMTAPRTAFIGIREAEIIFASSEQAPQANLSANVLARSFSWTFFINY